MSRLRKGTLIRRELAVAVFFAAAAIAMTWPLAQHLQTAASEDSLLNTWVLDWDYFATTHGRALFEANIFYPARQSLAFTENAYGLAVLTFPLFALGIAPLTIHNIALIVGFAACGYAMYLLARSMTRSTAAGIIAGIAYAFVGFRFHHLAHLPYVWSAWLPIVLLTTIRLLHAATWPRAFAFAGALIMNGLTALHWLAFGTTAAAATIIVIGVRTRNRQVWLPAAIAFLIAGGALLPFLLPYMNVAKIYGMQRQMTETFPNGARWRDWVIPNLQSKLYGRLSPGDSWGHERTLFPGLITSALAVLAFIRTGPRVRRIYILDALVSLAAIATLFGAMAGDVTLHWHSRTLIAYSGVAAPLLVLIILVAIRCRIRPYDLDFTGTAAALLWIGIGAWGARGVSGAFDGFLYRHASAFRGMRMPARWAMIAYVGIAILAAYGFVRVLDDRTKRARIAITAVCAAAMLFELRAAPIRWFLVPIDGRPVYQWLARTQLRGAVLELPMTQGDAYTYLWRSTEHHQPLINGVSGYNPPHYAALQDAYDATPIRGDFLARLEQLGCSIIVVHDEPLGFRRNVVHDWLRNAIASGRLMFVRRFDAASHSDWVFAVRHNEPNAVAWRAPETPDASGKTPSQNLAAFLAGNWTYVNRPFASIDVGPPAGTVRGGLVVSGWALAPAGVRQVNLRFANGAMVVRADRAENAPVKAMLPWYPNDPRPGFYKNFDGPPRGVRGETDMQLEIIDANGTVIRETPYFFRWLPRSSSRIVWKTTELEQLLTRLSVNTTENRGRLLSGSAAIDDFMSGLLRDSEVETDLSFAQRVVDVLVPAAPTPALLNRTLESLANGTSRERVVDDILRSREFAQRYIRAGHVEID